MDGASGESGVDNRRSGEGRRGKRKSEKSSVLVPRLKEATFKEARKRRCITKMNHEPSTSKYATPDDIVAESDS